MNLKVLPPTLRKNNRYLTIDIKIKGSLNKDELVAIVWDACIRFWGECNTSDFNLWVMKIYEIEKLDNYNYFKAIVRCQRGYEEKVRAALACITKYNNKRIAINTIAISGTIEASITKYIN